MVKCRRGCQFPLLNAVGRMHGEPHGTECNINASQCNMTSEGCFCPNV